jgi:hypothetical protein
MIGFEYSKKQIVKWFSQNNRHSLTISQWLSNNCPLISFFISLSKVNTDIQSKFISKTIMPWEKWGEKWFFVRKFLPFQLSEDFEFVTIHDINNSLPPREQLVNAISGKENSDIDYESKYMYWSLFMRLIELVRSKSNEWHLFPMWIIDYLKKCWIDWNILKIEWWKISDSYYEKLSKIPEKWIWRIWFNEYETNYSVYLKEKHAYAIIWFDINSKKIEIANPCMVLWKF